MGTIKTELGDYAGAIEDYSVALSLKPDLYAAFNGRGSAKYLQGNIKEAMEDFNQALILIDNYNPASNNKACSLIKNSKYDEALTILNDVIASGNNFAKAYLNRGLVKELLGDLEGACSDWKKAFELGVAEAQNYIKECK